MAKTTEERRTEAVVRKQEHDSLTIEEKIKKAEARPGNSEKELKRLRAQLENT